MHANNPIKDADQESWFLSRLESNPVPAEELLGFLDDMRLTDRALVVENWAEMLQETLLKQGQRDAGLNLLARRAAWASREAASLPKWKELAQKIIGENRDDQAIFAHAGFDRVVPPRECVRRLKLLLALKPGTLCYDKTWGFGVVSDVNLFYGRTEVEFEKKPRHQLSLAYAAEALELIGPDHLFARRHRDPAGFGETIRSNPAEIVRITLRSFGPMSLPALQQKLAPQIVAEADWKRFWDVARKALKSDPMVDIPAKRNEPIRLLKKEKSFDEDWFAALATERDMKEIIMRADELLADAPAVASLTEAQKYVAGDRLAFTLKGAGRAKPGLAARAVMAAHRLGIRLDLLDVQAQGRAYFVPDLFLAAVSDLPARQVRTFFDFLAELDPDRTVALCLELLKRFHIGLLNEAIVFLIEHGKEPDCAAIFREAAVSQKAEVELLCWLARNPERIDQWNLGSLPVLANLMLTEMENSYSGERLRAKNQLRERFGQKAWLQTVFDSMTALQRREMMQRIKDSSAWLVLDRQSVLGTVVKMYPALQEVLVEKKDGAGARFPLTSKRSYQERQIQLEKITNVEIPRIAREIGVARSYGDLRENFEYKAAKDQQALLLRRKAELEQMLHEVRPTDFKGYPADKAGVATGVTLAYPDGREERYYLLGVWDQDDRLKIISCESRMAKVLEGRKAGEQLMIPSESGDTPCTLREVLPLPAEIMEWIHGGPVA